MSSARQQEIFGGRNFLREQIFATWRLIPKIAKISASQKFPAIQYLLTAGVISCIPHCDKNIECMTDFAPHSGYGEGVDECQLQDDCLSIFLPYIWES